LEGVVETTLLADRCILVVEDEPLVSLDITARLQDAGARVLAASHLEKALGLAECPEVAAGVLDFDLGTEDSTPLCWKLVDRGIPFVFHSGRMYSAFRQWPSAPVILKPATRGLIGAVAGLFRSAAK
jgi:CheY-like chemotaxis protein